MTDENNYDERNEQEQTNREKIYKAFSNKLKVHLSLKNKTWRNGIVKETNPDFFIFIDEENGEEAFFFLEVFNVEP